jgi:hypothetical protein
MYLDSARVCKNEAVAIQREGKETNHKLQAKILDIRTGRKSDAHKLSPNSFVENVLIPVNLAGVVVPWSKSIGREGESQFKLVCTNGREYFFVPDPEWNEVLSGYSWDWVKVIGLLNIQNATIIPQKVYPKYPHEKIKNVIQIADRRGRSLLKKVVKNLNDFVVIPIAVWAMLAA